MINQLLIICGPTATGKTKLGLKLAKIFNGQVISADSRQVYQGMDIGTGKDKPSNGQTILGLDLVKPDQKFSVANFVKFTLPAIKKIQSKNQLPILVGGTGLYLKAITDPFQTIHIKANLKLREKLADKNVLDLQKILQSLAPKKFTSMNHSDRLNPRRLIRAIEIAKSGKPLSTLKPNFNSLWIGLKTNKDTLDKRVEKRVHQRIKQGSQAEVKKLLDQGYSWDLPSMSAMGYQQWRPFFKKPKISRQKVITTWITAEKQYLRRQLTWFNRQKQVHWFDLKNPDMDKKVVNFLSSWYTSN